MLKINQVKFKQTEIGLIPEGWEVLELGELGKVVTGKTPPTKNQENYGGEYPFVCIPDMGNSVYIDSTNKSISEIGLETVRNCLLPKDSIMVSCIATIGKVGITSKSSITNQQINSVIPNKKILPRFLYYRLNNFTEILSSYGGGGAVYDIISKSKFEKIPLPISPLLEQRKITDVLGALDEKIELNRKINQTLESIGQTIFNELFFNVSNGKTGKIGDVIEIFDSKRIPLSSMQREKRKGNIPYYGATSIMDYIDDYIFDGTYLLLGEDGSVAKEDGKPFTQYVWGKIWVNNHAHILQGKNGFSTELLKIFFDNVDIKPFVTGAVQPKLNQENLKNIPINIPNNEVLIKANLSVKLLFNLIKNNTNGVNILSQIRDSLLPRLMSGKLRVK